MLSRGRLILVASAAGSIGGAALAVVEAIRATTALGDQAEGNVLALLAALVGRYGVTGALVGCVGGVLAAVVGRRPASLRRVVVGIVGVLVGAWLASHLYSGPAIREHWAAWPLRIVTPAVVALGAVLLAAAVERCARASTPQVIGALTFVAAAVVLDAFDTWGTLTAYGYLRTALWVGVLALLALAIAVPWVASGGRAPRVGIGCLLVVVVLAAVAPPEGFVAFAFRERTRYGGRCLDAWRLVLSPDATDDDVAGDAAFLARRTAELSPAHRAHLRRRLDAALADRGDWNLLWITIDTLRADRLSCHGYRPVTTPVLDALAAEGARFAQASAQFPITHYSFQSMFYGRYPTATPLFRRARGIHELAEKSVTLAALLSRRGFFTGTVPAIAAANLKVGPYEVMGTGFDVVQPGRPKTWKSEAKIQTHCASTFFDEAKDRRWHLWLHYMEPHHPYKFHAEHDYGGTPEQRYLSEIAHADTEIGKVLASLRERGLDDRTIIVVNSDHGEAFGEHATYYHGSTLYEEQLHVPLIVRVPGLPPRVLQRSVENIDIMPTVLDLLDIDHDLPMQGASLVPLLLGGDDDPDAPEDLQLAELPGTFAQLSSTSAHRDALRHGRFKLVWNPADGIAELYDLDADPGEIRNVAGEHADVVKRMRGMLAVLKAECRSVNREGDVSPRDLGAEVAALPPAERGARLQEAVRRREQGVREAVVAYVADESMPETTRRLVTLEAETVLGDGLAAAAWRLVTPRSGWGSVVVGLDLLTRCARPTLTVDEMRAAALRDLLAAPAPVSLRAALVLARAGRDDGRDRLERGADNPDGEERFLGLLGLSMLGVVRDRAELEEQVIPLRSFPWRCVPLLEGLAAVPASTVVPELWELLHDIYLDHRVRDAALALLARLDPRDAAVAWLPSLSAWDPEATKKTQAIADRVLGRARREQLEEAGRLTAEARDGAQVGRYRAAVDAWKRAGEICGDDRAAAPCLLQAARLLHVLGDTFARDELCRRIAVSGAQRTWLVAAERLPRVAAKEEPLSLVAEEIRPSRLVPQIPGMPGLWRVRVKNPGPHHVPGGRWPLAPLLLAGFKRGRQRLAFDVARLPLPEQGIAVGSSAWTWLPSQTPALGGDLDVRLAGVWPRAGVVRLARDEELLFSLHYPGEGAVGMDPTSVTFTGADIRDGWISAPHTLARGVDADGAFTWVAGARESWLLSAMLADRQKPVELTIALAAVSRHAATARMRLEVAWGELPGQSALQTLDLEVPADGQWVERTATFPPRDGKGVRWMRVTPLDTSEILKIRYVRVRVP